MKRTPCAVSLAVGTLLTLGTLPAAAAGICDHVETLSRASGVATMAAAAEIGFAAAPVSAVAHSSGSLILTGASGYLAKTLGTVATAWAVATAPVTLAVTGGVLVAGAGLVAACYMSDGISNQLAEQQRHPR